jgi:hypothetical protein
VVRFPYYSVAHVNYAGKKMKLETLNIFEASTTRPKTNISASSRMTYTDECSTVTLPIEPPS